MQEIDVVERDDYEELERKVNRLAEKVERLEDSLSQALQGGF
jgi:polyhydroxyalkanoate synthesis regulator phasin